MYKDDKLIFLMGEKKKGGGTDNNKHFPEQEQGTETPISICIDALWPGNVKPGTYPHLVIRISTRRTELGSLAMLQELPRSGNPDFQHCR